jgi:hypothetical protein
MIMRINYIMRWMILFLVLLLSLSVFAAIGQADYAEDDMLEPPGQPSSGPGGSDYAYDEVVKSKHGSFGRRYWIYEPKNSSTGMPESAPLIVFLHGWGAIIPDPYEAWLEHITKKGNIVVYPQYQSSLLTLPKYFVPNAIDAVINAIELLQSEDHVDPELENFAIVGHSMGGLITMNMAALASSGEENYRDLPRPRAVMCVEAGTTDLGDVQSVELGNLSVIPENTLLLVVVGDLAEEQFINDAKTIFNGTDSISLENKDFVTVVSHNRETSPGVWVNLTADHYVPCTIDGETDALDYYAYWKLFDGLCDAAFYGTNREYALGNTSEQRYMGEWSDGVPVKELIVTDYP